MDKETLIRELVDLKAQLRPYPNDNMDCYHSKLFIKYLQKQIREAKNQQQKKNQEFKEIRATNMPIFNKITIVKEQLRKIGYYD